LTHAEIIIKLIRKHLYKPIHECNITDGTSNIGGFTIPASKYFKSVNAIELTDINMRALKNNVESFDRANVSLIKGDCIEIIPKLSQDVIFIDPPWGGPYGYAEEVMEIKLSGLTMADFVNRFDHNVIAIRLPKNYDFSGFIRSIKPRKNVTFYSVANYYLAVI
jgi:precorrin-6B methylase 2